VNVNRGGPGLGTIQPGQGDYFQSVKGGGHGDYKLIVLAPATVQEMSDFVKEGFELAFKYRNPVLILTDGALGQMMEKVELFPQQERKFVNLDWATTGKTPERSKNVITSLNLKPEVMEEVNIHLQKKYKRIEANEIRYETIMCEDADFIITAYGLVARICTKAAQMAREKGIKVGVIRPISLFPFPYKVINEYAGKVTGILDVEMNAGQMIEDVKLAVNGKIPVEFYGRMGGIVPAPEEILKALEEKLAGVKI
jgi:2-oxoglutarate ferredoxin oxidoreductase subunit alpha